MAHNTCKSMGRVLCVVRRQFDDCLFGVSYPLNKDAWTFSQMSMVCFFEIATPESGCTGLSTLSIPHQMNLR